MKLLPILESIENNGTFVGYHCSKHEITKFNGDIDVKYAEYVPDILNGMYYSDLQDLRTHFNRFDANEYGFSVDIDNLPEPHDEDYDRVMNEIIVEISAKYRWIFVFEKHPLEQYGEYTYEVYFKQKAHHIHDKHELLADIYLYRWDNAPILKPT